MRAAVNRNHSVDGQYCSVLLPGIAAVRVAFQRREADRCEPTRHSQHRNGHLRGKLQENSHYMAANSKIEWTDATWNPVRGCTRISPGCFHCYAERFAERFRGVQGHPFEQGFDLRLIPQRLNEPIRWKKPQRIFVNSMSDLFHEDVPVEYIRQLFEVMCQADQHQYQILTKRAERLEALAASLPWPPHIWMGVSVEDADWICFSVSGIIQILIFKSLKPIFLPLKKLT